MNDTVYSTGKIATICRVAPRTVSKWFDSGKLQGYRIPLSKDRRVPRENLLAFLKEHGFPIPEELAGGPPAISREPVDFSRRPMAESVANVMRFAKGESHDADYLMHDCRVVATSFETLAIGNK